MPLAALWLAFTLYTGSLVWAGFHLGATATETLYRLFLALLLGAFLLNLLERPRAPGGWRDLAVLAVGAGLLLQAARLPPLEGRGYVVAAVGWLGLFIALRLAGRHRRWLLALFWLLIALGVVEAGLGIVQALTGFDRIGSVLRQSPELASGTLYNANHFAALLNLALGLAAGALLAAGGRRSGSLRAARPLLAALCLTLVLGVVLSRSRGGIAALVATLCYLVALIAARRLRRDGDRSRLLVGLVLLVAGGGLLIAGVDRLVVEMVRPIETEGRPAIYADTVRMIVDRPLTGVGPGMYLWRFGPYQSASVNLRFRHAHNDYLQHAAEWGIPLALALWLFILRRLVRSAALFLGPAERWRRGVALGCSAAIFSIAAHSLVDFSLQIPAVLVVFTTILGLSWIAERGAAGPFADDVDR